MKGEWRSVRLGDICVFNYGKALPASARNGGKTPVFGSNGIVGHHDSAITKGRTIVIGRKGSFGEINYSDKACWPIDTTYFVDELSTEHDIRWLAHRLACLGLNRLNKAAAVPGLNREDAYRQELLLPPLSEQRRIAAILDLADTLRAKHQEALTQLDRLTQAIFIDMFGDVAAKGWPMDNVAGIALSRKGAIRTGPFGSQLLHSEFVDDGIPVLGIDNVVANEFRWGERRYISDKKYQELKRYTVQKGDVLITIMGTCGRCAVVPEDIPIAINTKHICCITLDQNKCLPSFLHAYFLRHPIARKYLARTAKGAIMDGLNMGIIKEMPVPLPPIGLQRDFSTWSAAVEKLKIAHRSSLANLDALFAGLQHRAFSGKL
ncbi:restriction endonuclease subunit S [Collimonas silvisoli]|uniref:restriction endonuclease subunit S n=1 Tax=Collimonas silvisoli TaxID=2825884 RepID=UPI001B8C09B2|nr:restriction endonuclease subunit S [Collimonas silvisoli]